MARYIELTRIRNDFEQEVFELLRNNLSDTFLILSPFHLPEKGRQIDGLIIGEKCVFTIEVKNIKGKVSKPLNGETIVIDKNDRKIDFLDKHEDPCEQAENHAKRMLNYLDKLIRPRFIWVKSILVFQKGSTFENVFTDYRNITDTTIRPFICSLDEIQSFVEQYNPGRRNILDKQLQENIANAIKLGLRKLDGSITDPTIETHKYAETTIPRSNVVEPIMKKKNAGLNEKTNKKRNLFTLTTLIVFIFIILAGLSLLYLSAPLQPEGCIIVNKASVYDGPASKYDVKGNLAKGTCVKIDGRTKSNYWLRITGLTLFRGGWITIDSIESKNIKINSLPIIE